MEHVSEKVDPAQARAALALLNAADSCEEIASQLSGRLGREEAVSVSHILLAKRKDRGGFRCAEELAEAAADPQIAESILKALAAQTTVKTSYKISGKLVTSGKADFEKDGANVIATIGEVEVGRAPVAADGSYEIDFDYRQSPAPVMIRVLPQDAEETNKTPGLTRTIYASGFRPTQAGYRVKFDVIVGPYPLWRKIRCNVHGTVYAWHSAVAFSPLPMVRIDFFRKLFNGTDSFLTTSFSGPEGEYQAVLRQSVYAFPWSTASAYQQLFPLPYPSAEISFFARIYQWRNGSWEPIYDTPVYTTSLTDYELSIMVPQDAAASIPDPSPALDHGFRWDHIGHLPLDSSHLVAGYARTTGAADVAAVGFALDHQPFCGSLYLRGLFGALDNIDAYTVESTPCDASGNGDDWQYVADPLVCEKWIAAENCYVAQTLGPDPVTHFYENVDGESQSIWPDRSLKLVWHTPNVADGFYKLRIKGFKNGQLVANCVMETPSLRIANAMPIISLEPDPALNVGPCGSLVLTGGNNLVPFKVTAYDPAGHVWRLQIDGTRGRDREPAGSQQPEAQDGTSLVRSPGSNWSGIRNEMVGFEVAPLSSPLNECPAIAYAFTLTVWSSATNCETGSLRHATAGTNLIIS